MGIDDFQSLMTQNEQQPNVAEKQIRAAMKYPNVLPLKGVIQTYDWGGYTFIPELLGKKPSRDQPQAELWMGTHDRGAALVSLGSETLSLGDWIAADPAGILGEQVNTRFGALPFLFKILDVRKMLSIQAHPTKTAAEAGFRRENEAGIPITAPHRNYKDDNHKPEIMVALSDFWLLHGFKSEEAIEAVLRRTPEFQPLRSVFRGSGIRGLYQYVMELPAAGVDELLAPLAVRLERALMVGTLDRSQADYWAAHAFRDYTRNGHYDRGIFSIYLFNLVHLEAGEGIFQDANIPHAYLEGVNVELMANSDNVFRGGLTSKHVDVQELMQHLDFRPVTPGRLTGSSRLPHERAYAAPVPDFDLSRIELQPGQEYRNEPQKGPAIYIVLSGKIQTELGPQGRGAIFFSPHAAAVRFSGVESSVIFRAGVPV